MESIKRIIGRSDLKYNYVILSTDWEVYRQLYSDVIGRKDVIYVAGLQAAKRGLKKILYRAHFNKLLNRIIPLPFKRIWNRSYFTDTFEEKKTVCFLLFRDWVSLDGYTGYINWLKKRYPASRFVWFLHDMIAEHRDFYTDKVLEVEQYKGKFDLVVTCNPTEALKHKLFYHSVPISKLAEDNHHSRCDVLFIGQNKGRLQRLFHIYDAFTRKGAHCKFFIFDTSQPVLDSVREGVTFLNRPMPYRDCQEWVAGANCLLELRYNPNAGETLRSSEALIYGKKLITDNPSLANSTDFDSRNLRILDSIDSVEQIDLSFLRDVLDVSSNTTDAFRRRFSPVTFLEDIDAKLG